MPGYLRDRSNLGKPASEKTSIGGASVEHRWSIGDESAESQTVSIVELNENQGKIVELLRQNPHYTGAELAEEIGISKRNIEANIKKIKEMGVLVRHGSTKEGYWEVVDRQ